jgi:hypothetical protein
LIIAFTTLTTNNLLICSTTVSNTHNGKLLPPLSDFIHDLYYNKKRSYRNGLPCAVKLFTLIYLLRLKSKLPENARGAPDTPYRLFLAAVLTSSKYLSETGTGLTSMHLSALTNHIYTSKDINRMERSFLGLMRYDLWVSREDIQSFMKLYGDLIQVDIHHVNLSQQSGSALLNFVRCSSSTNALDTTTTTTTTTSTDTRLDTSTTATNATAAANGVSCSTANTISYPA